MRSSGADYRSRQPSNHPRFSGFLLLVSVGFPHRKTGEKVKKKVKTNDMFRSSLFASLPVFDRERLRTAETKRRKGGAGRNAGSI
jgi:hypothetical protein